MTQRSNRPRVTLFTDGSVTPGNPGHGGWSAILLLADHTRVMSGYIPWATNNNMETRGVLEGLLVLKVPCIVDLYSDSMYVIKGLSALKYKRILGTNSDLWIALQPLVEAHNVIAHHVKGHSGELYNEYADTLAGNAALIGKNTGEYRYDEYVQAVPEAVKKRSARRKALREKRLAELSG